MSPSANIKAVLMCGGLGTRLRPFTSVLPKPLLPVGDRSVLERLLERLHRFGIRDVYLSVGYKAEMIEWVLRDGRALGLNLTYIHEESPLGTAGALDLMRDGLTDTFLMMNGDLVTKLDFSRMIAFHRDRGAVVTVGTKEYAIQVPYGVVEDWDGKVTALREKPTYTNRINAGIYLIEPSALDLVPHNQRYDATQLIEDALHGGRPVFSYLIEEYWLDMGRLEDYDQANADAKRWIEEESRE
jgi:NDP-sugar pyrophosphorylase family protein